ncbi:MAG: UPF0149 family protein [Chlorobiaceae bacterium]
MNSSDSLQQPLSMEEFGHLENLFFSDSMPEESFSSLEMLDGYMTALIVGPEEIHPDIWIPFIWNQEKSDESFFTSEAEAKIIKELLIRHMNTIAVQFRSDPNGFIPPFEKVRYPHAQQKELAVENWALGFTMGIQLIHESWKPLFSNEETGMLAMPMLILSKITDDYKALKKKEITDMRQLLPDFVIRIYDYWQQKKS